MTTQIQISHEDLPLWMQQARQEFDWSILIALAMSIAIAWTFLLNDDLPAGHQLEHTLFQASDIVTAFEEGRFYPRWSPYTINGYGAPIPNFYPMGAPYIVAVIETLFTNNLIQAARIVFVLTYAVAGLSVYLLISRRTDAPIGLFTTVLYLFSPMLGSTIPYVMGDLALLMASALLPLSLYSAYQSMNNRHARDFALNSVIFGLFLWIHPQIALFSILMSIIFAQFDHLDISWFQRVPRLLIAIVIGGLLASFFWMPAIFEAHLVTWYMPETYNLHQLNLAQLFEPMQQIDSGLVMPQPQFKLGWVIIIFAITGILVHRIASKQPHRFYLLTSVIGCLLIVVGLVLSPTEVWLLVPITLCFSILGGRTLTIRHQFSTDIGRLVMVLIIAATVIFSTSVWLIPSSNLMVSNANAVSQFRFEQQGFGFPTLLDNQPLPSTIDPATPINRFLLNSYELNSPQRYEEQQNNANTIVSLLNTSTHSQTYTIYNAQPRELNFLIPYFDGWQAYLSGESIPTYANPDTGLLTVEVPSADNEQLIIALTSTETRTFAWVVSFGAMAVILFLVIQQPQFGQQADENYRLVETMRRSDVRLLLFMFVALGVTIIIFTSDLPPIQLQYPSAFTLSQSLPLESRTSVGLEATTFELDKRRVSRGDELAITIYWKALTSIQSNFKSRVLLRDINNRLLWYTGDLHYPGSLVSRRWIRNRFVADQHTIRMPDNLIDGEYQILVELYPCDNNLCQLDTAVLFFDRDANLTGKQLEIPVTILVE